MRTNKKKRLRPQTKSGHVKFRPTAVADCSLIAEYGERDGDLQGALDSPPGGRVEPRIGFMGRGDPAYAVCFLYQISPDVWLLSGSEVTCPFRKNAEEQNNQGATFFFPLLLLLFVNAKRRARRLFTKSVSARVKHFQVRIEQSSTLSSSK